MNKRNLFSIWAVFAALALFLAACAPAAPAKDMSDPVTVVQTFYELFNANKLDQAMALTAEDYVMNDPFGTYDRTAAAAQWQAVRDSGITFNQTNFVHTGDGRVTSCYEVLENGTSVDKGCGNVTHVRDGKIIYDGLEPAEQIWIVQQYYEAMNAGQFERMAAFMADDMVVTFPGGKISGKQEIIKANQDTIGAGLTFALSELENTDGRVTSCFNVLQKGTRIDQGCTGVTLVRRGQIIFDGLAPDEPEYVVQRYYQALNAKDVELAMSFVASDAVFINPTGTYKGADAIRESLVGLNKNGITFDLSNIHKKDGKVVYDYRVLQGGNLVDQGTNGLTVVKDGKITFDGTEDTDPATALDPAEVAQSFYGALNEGDLESVMALVADNIQCRGDCYLNGIQSFRFYMEGILKQGGRTDITNLVVDGDKVTYDWAYYSEAGFFQARGVETLQIKDGKIVLVEGTAN